MDNLNNSLINIPNTIKTIGCSTTTFSSLLGSVTAVIRDYYKNVVFPKDFIKSYYISTRDFSEEIEDEDVIRKSKPILYIKPNFNFSAEEGIMGRLPEWTYTDDFIFKPMFYHYGRVIFDDTRQVYMYYGHERHKITYNIDIVFSSRMSAINAAYFFKNSVRHKKPYYLEDIWLETTIPKSMIYAIANFFNFDIEESTEDLANLNNYLNNYSNFQIVRKKSLSSGIENYYYRFKTRILVTFPDYPEVDEGKSSGQIETDFTMSTTMEIEFNAPNNFFLELSDKINIREIQDRENMEILTRDGRKPDIVITTPINEVPDMTKDTKKLIVWQGYIAESNVIDTVNIEEVLNKDTNIIINENNKIDPNLNNEMFEILLYKDDDVLNPITYKVDWETKDIINKKPVKDATYYFGLYIDIFKAKEVLTKYYSNKDLLDKINRIVKEE